MKFGVAYLLARVGLFGFSLDACAVGRRAHEAGYVHVAAIEKSRQSPDQPIPKCAGLNLMKEGAMTLFGKHAAELEMWVHSGKLSFVNQMETMRLDPCLFFVSLCFVVAEICFRLLATSSKPTNSLYPALCCRFVISVYFRFEFN